MKRLVLVSMVALALGWLRMSEARGIRNNNPLNIRVGNDWQGERAISTDKAFEEYESPEFGYRAAVKILRNYRARGLHTVADIINAWAPPNENNTNAYLWHVLAETGWQPEHVVAEAEGDYLTLFRAMAIIENGREYANHPALSNETIKKGIALA